MCPLFGKTVLPSAPMLGLLVLGSIARTLMEARTKSS